MGGFSIHLISTLSARGILEHVSNFKDADARCSENKCYKIDIYKDNHFIFELTLGSHTGCFMTLNINLQWDNN